MGQLWCDTKSFRFSGYWNIRKKIHAPTLIKLMPHCMVLNGWMENIMVHIQWHMVHQPLFITHIICNMKRWELIRYMLQSLIPHAYLSLALVLQFHCRLMVSTLIQFFWVFLNFVFSEWEFFFVSNSVRSKRVSRVTYPLPKF